MHLWKKAKEIKDAADEQLRVAEKARLERARALEEARNSWSTSTSEDEMTKLKSAYATSPSVFSTRNMSFPYEGVQAWLGVG